MKTQRRSKLVMCECYKVDGTPAAHNNRAAAVPVFEAVKDHHPWFGLEQVEWLVWLIDFFVWLTRCESKEYSLLTRFKRPLGWPTGGYPGPQVEHQSQRRIL